MPAPSLFKVNDQEKQYLKSCIEKEYNIKIESAPSCKLLSELIFKRKKITISYSTIRRLFNLIPKNVGSPSMYTLDSIVKSIGFADWKEFKNYQEKYNVNSINQNIQLYFNQIDDSNNLIFETVKNISLYTWNGGYQLQYIILLAIQKNDFKLLSKIVKLNFEINNQLVYECLVMSFQSFYFEAIKNNEKVINFVKDHLGQSLVLQKCLVQAYVDERYLNGFFGDWLAISYQKELEDFSIFKNLLLCEKSYINQNQELAKFYFESVLHLLKNFKFKIHPILLARISAWELILYHTESYLHQFFKKLKEPFEKADFLVIYSRLIWSYYQSNKIIIYLEKDLLNDFPTVKDFFQKGRYNILLLSISINYLLNDENEMAKEYFELFDHNILGYDIVNFDFYRNWIAILKKKFISPEYCNN